jgi:hypothetical protein
MTIKLATKEDIPGLLELNGAWLRQNLSGDTSRGFLSGAFDEQDFMNMVNDRMVVVAVDENGVASYMLSMNNATLPILDEHIQVANRLKTDSKVSPDSRIAVGVQTAVREEYHGTGLIVEVRKCFLDTLRDRFDYLFTTISKQNIRSYKSATHFGWKTMGDNEEHYYLLLKV